MILLFLEFFYAFVLGSSDESDSDGSGKVNGQSNGVVRVAPPLPTDVPANLMAVISALKEISIKNSNIDKNNFFTSEVNALVCKYVDFVNFILFIVLLV